MPKMKTSFKGLVKLLAKSLYSEADVFIRELIQNAHDSIKLRQVNERWASGKIEVFTDPHARSITFLDNGIGMDKTDIDEFLSTIGSSGTGVRTEDLARQNITVETIGQFGIGLLSAFVVAERIDIHTCKSGSSEAFHWVNHGSEDYELSNSNQAPKPGSKVVVTISPEHIRHIDESKVKETIRRYADFLPYPIYLNGNGHVNVINAPWHKTNWANEKDYLHSLYQFLNERYQDTPLHVIPVDSTSPRAKGALYISNQHIPIINTSGVVDIFQERMHIRANDQELLPDWAKFIRGVIDSPDLNPTAARDNVMKNTVYYQMRRTLGDLIIQSMINLANSNNAKFNRICDWHHYHLKGMAVNNEDFFKAIIDYLPFETNKGNLNLKQYIGRQTAEPGRKIPVYFFSFGYDSNQFYDLCEAKGLIAVNTGRYFDETLVRKYVELHSSKLELKQLDNLDDPNLYQRLPEDEHRGYFHVENAIRRALEQAGIMRVKPTTKRFAPISMSGVIIATEKIEAFEKMKSLLSEPALIEGLGELAQDMTEQLRKTPLDLFINADNRLINMLKEIKELDHIRYNHILVGVYNNAVLYSQQRMTPENAKIFYQQLQSLMISTLELESKLNKTLSDKEALQLQVMEQSLEKPTSDHDWISFFVMMPYDPAYNCLEETLRDILETPPYCFELILARDKHRDATVKKNLVRHIQSVDGYIADVSEHSPNVMMELGWVHFDPDFSGRPLLILHALDSQKEFPVDIAERLKLSYSSLKSPDLCKELASAFENHEPLQSLLKKRKKRFLSLRMLRKYDFLYSDEVKKAVFATFKTVEDILTTTEKEFKERLANSGHENLGFLWQPLTSALKDQSPQTRK